jgi:ADP-ribose pyrophosphatase YjhB (NUDIX family)
MNPSTSGSVSEERQFCRFQTGGSPEDGYFELPTDGLCLSSFVLLSPKHHPERVLVGKINPKAPWKRIGALDARRVRLNTGGWMIPACQLMFFESPEQAAHRVIAEQLGIGPVALGPPVVFSETYRSPRHSERPTHWDLEFLFRAVVDLEAAPKNAAWTELEFVDPARTPRSAFTRSHDEVLENAGFRIG